MTRIWHCRSFLLASLLLVVLARSMLVKGHRSEVVPVVGGAKADNFSRGHHIKDPCETVSDCKFVGAVCSEFDGQCHCKVGEFLQDGACIVANCNASTGCPFNQYYEQQACVNGVCGCVSPAHPNEPDHVTCVHHEMDDYVFFLLAIVVVLFVVLPICGIASCTYQAYILKGGSQHETGGDAF